MKKSLLALTVLGSLATIASAQSNVTLYGRADGGLGKTFGGKTQMTSSYKETSMLGLRGREDLGGGQVAIFNFEQEVDLKTGAGGSWNRAAYVGIGGGFGEFSMGRRTTPQNDTMGIFDLNSTANNTSALKNLGLRADGNLGGNRANSQFMYTSPEISGFQARASVVLKEDKAAPAAGAADTRKTSYQLAASYKNGPLSLGVVVASKMAESSSNRTGFALGARYDFGTFIVSGLYTQDESRTTGKGFGLGVAVPLGALTVGAQVARVTNNPSATREGATAVELFANYKLSKRTLLYAGYGGLNKEGKAINGTTGSNTFGMGMVHRF